MNLYSLNCIRQEYDREVDKNIKDFYDGGACDEVTLSLNESRFRSILLKTQVLNKIVQPDVSATVLNEYVDLPVLIAPTAFQSLVYPDGEIEVAKACANQGTIYTISALSTPTLSSLSSNSLIKPWFQLYIYKDRSISESLIALANSSGCGAIVLTVDAPIFGKREKDIKNDFDIPLNFELSSLKEAGVKIPSDASNRAFYLASQLNPLISWSDVEWIRSKTALPLLIKGIVSEEDASIALQHDISGMIISNHGGRQLDTTPATIDLLPSIKNVVGDTLPLLIDGGIRRGTDVLKALALGANAVMLGRPVLWGLSVGGQRGVEKVLMTIKEELLFAMKMCGCPNLQSIHPNIIWSQ